VSPPVASEDPRRLRTRDALVRAALLLFRQRGFANVTAEQIAEAAGVSRRTFFRYFPTKEAVAFPEHAERVARFTALLADRQRGEPRHRAVRGALLVLAADLMARREEVVGLQTVVNGSPELIAYERILDLEWESVFAHALRDPTLRDAAAERRARMLAGATIGAVRAALREWFDTKGEASLIALGAEALDLLERGRGA